MENISDISFYDYGAIAVYLIMVKDALEFDIEEAKKRLVSNLEGRGDKLKLEYIFRIIPGEENKSALKEYEELRKQMENALKKICKVYQNLSIYQSMQGTFTHMFLKMWIYSINKAALRKN